MHFRITNDADERDVQEIFEMLKNIISSIANRLKTFPSAYFWKTRQAGSSPA